MNEEEKTAVARQEGGHAMLPSSMSNVNLFDPNQLIAAESFLKRMLRTDKGGIKTVEDGLAIMMRAQDLGLPFSTCIEHIHVINGKTGVDIHVIKSLLLKAGCTWKCTKDYQPVYEYTDGINVYNDTLLPEYAVRCRSQKEADERSRQDESGNYVYVYPVKYYKDFQGNVYKDYQLSANRFAVVTNKAQTEAVVKAGKIPVFRIAAVPVDYVAEYELTRDVKGRTMTSIGHFSYGEAVAAGLMEKETYRKYARILISHRAFTYAARDIGSDILFGVMETGELKIVNGMELSDEDIIDIETDGHEDDTAD